MTSSNGKPHITSIFRRHREKGMRREKKKCTSLRAWIACRDNCLTSKLKLQSLEGLKNHLNMATMCSVDTEWFCPLAPSEETLTSSKRLSHGQCQSSSFSGPARKLTCNPFLSPLGHRIVKQELSSTNSPHGEMFLAMM